LSTLALSIEVLIYSVIELVITLCMGVDIRSKTLNCQESGSPTMEKTQAVDVVLRPDGSKDFVLLPKRWTVVGEACRRHTDLRLVALVSS
jgi:hypothetical protein